MAAARREGAALAPDLPGVRLAARAAVPLVVRTLTLRAALLLTTYAVVLAAAAGEQAVDLATHQLAMTLWTFLAFALDAIAIAAQAITGRYLGAGDAAATRVVTDRMVRWGWRSGVVTGLALAAASPLLGPLFTADDRVHDLLVPVLLVAALGQPAAGVVFVLDGVLIGAGDGRYLARAGVVTLVVYAPVLLLAVALGGGLVVVWAVFAWVFIGARLRRARAPRPRRGLAGHRRPRHLTRATRPRHYAARMRSLATAALGLVVVLVHAEAGGFDLLPDPLGWLLVLLGLHDLRGHPRHRRLAGLAWLALAVSVVLWWPGVVDDLYDADPALVWAVTLPQLACCALLRAHRRRARGRGRRPRPAHRRHPGRRGLRRRGGAAGAGARRRGRRPRGHRLRRGRRRPAAAGRAARPRLPARLATGLVRCGAARPVRAADEPPATGAA